MMARVALTGAFAFLASAAFAGSHGGYHVRVPGFGQHRVGGETVDQGHFDQVGALPGCSNPGPGALFRGGAPDFGNPNALRTLKENKIGLVVDLRAEGGSRKAAEERTLLANGIGYANIPMTTEEPLPAKIKVRVHLPARDGAPDEVRAVTVPALDAVNVATRLLEERLGGGKNAFVHCAHGEDRTGTVVGRLRNCDGWRKEFNAYGGTFYPALKKVFEASIRPDEAGAKEFNDALRQLDPGSRCKP